MNSFLNVKTLEGDHIDLNNHYNNKPILLLFYNNQCLGCTGRAIPFAYELKQEFPFIEVIGIHVNFNQKVSKQDIYDIFTSKELPFPIYFDIKQQLYQHFNCEGTPHWIILNNKHEVIHSLFGSQDGAQNRLVYAMEELKTSHRR